MFATAPVNTTVPTSAILELYGTYRSQFKIRKNEVSGAAVVFLPTPLLLFIQTARKIGRWFLLSLFYVVVKKIFVLSFENVYSLSLSLLLRVRVREAFAVVLIQFTGSKYAL